MYITYKAGPGTTKRGLKCTVKCSLTRGFDLSDSCKLYLTLLNKLLTKYFFTGEGTSMPSSFTPTISDTCRKSVY